MSIGMWTGTSAAQPLVELQYLKRSPVQVVHPWQSPVDIGICDAWTGAPLEKIELCSSAAHSPLNERNDAACFQSR